MYENDKNIYYELTRLESYIIFKQVEFQTKNITRDKQEHNIRVNSPRIYNNTKDLYT